MMEMYLGEIAIKLEALKKIAEMPIKTKYVFKLKDLYKTLTEKQKTYTEVREEIVKKYAKKDESGNPIVENNMVTFEGDNVQLASKELNELNSEKLSFEFEPINVEDAGLEKIDLATVTILDGFLV